jgi:hypothetical protein
MTEIVNQELQLKTVSELRRVNAGFDKRQSESLINFVPDSTWQQLFESETKLMKEQLSKDVSLRRDELSHSSCDFS